MQINSTMNKVTFVLLFVCLAYHTSNVDGLRCWGINDGCCTKENPCEKGDGDCDNDEECAGGLTCGKDNCGWHHMDASDDCCMGEKNPDLCKKNNGGCSHKCVSVLGVVTCSCPENYVLGNDKKTCSVVPSDLDDGTCESVSKADCQKVAEHRTQHAKCPSVELVEVNDNSYPPGCYQKHSAEDKRIFFNRSPSGARCSKDRTCICKKGTEQRYPDKCKKNNGGCSHKCVSVKGVATCSCPKDHVLGNDKKTCFDSQCGIHSHCTTFKGQCWCHNDNNAKEQREACGYPSGYQGKYYSIFGTNAARDLIIAMGLKPNEQHCKSNMDCYADCATNQCSYGGDTGCWGARLSCWDDKMRWARKHAGIVRCVNYE